MALYISNGLNQQLSGEWHVTHERRTTVALHSYAMNVDMLQADGDELDAIKVQFPNLIPHNGNRVVRWFGDNARFICGNLDLNG
jgi:hypothetical protein